MKEDEQKTQEPNLADKAHASIESLLDRLDRAQEAAERMAEIERKLRENRAMRCRWREAISAGLVAILGVPHVA